MIGKLHGTLLSVNGNVGLIDTASGVGYRTYLTPSLLGKYPVAGPIEVLTYLQVRDDALVLFGFENQVERDFFDLLLSVSGVGPKTAYSVICHGNTQGVIKAVTENDVSFFSGIPGLGKKTAMKIILELSQKLKTEFKFQTDEASEDDKTVVDALVSLGYSRQDARHRLQKIDKNLTVEEKIKQALNS